MVMAYSQDPNSLQAPDNGPIQQQIDLPQGMDANDPNARMQAIQAYAYKDFMSQFGRAPSVAELNQITPNYTNSDMSANLTGGKAAVASYYSTLSNTPANYYARQQQQWQTNAPQQYGAVDQLVQSTLGRSATDDEKSHYGTLIASGQADPYTIGQFLQSLPEYQNKQDTQFRQGLDTQLQQSDSDFFNRTKGNIVQQYALMGRSTSPALDVALTDLSAQLSSQRQGYLANLSASQYGGNKSAALANYGATQNDVMGRINNNASTQYQNMTDFNNRTNSVLDYNRQAQDYDRYMQNYGPGKGLGTLDYLNAAFNGINSIANVVKSAKGGPAMPPG